MNETFMKRLEFDIERRKAKQEAMLDLKKTVSAANLLSLSPKPKSMRNPPIAYNFTQPERESPRKMNKEDADQFYNRLLDRERRKQDAIKMLQ